MLLQFVGLEREETDCFRVRFMKTSPRLVLTRISKQKISLSCPGLWSEMKDVTHPEETSHATFYELVPSGKSLLWLSQQKLFDPRK